MLNASKVAVIMAEYQTLKTSLQTRTRGQDDPPEDLDVRLSLLMSELIATPASSGEDLAWKAVVLLDWMLPEDLPTDLAVSLCFDAVRLFLPGSDMPAAVTS